MLRSPVRDRFLGPKWLIGCLSSAWSSDWVRSSKIKKEGKKRFGADLGPKSAPIPSEDLGPMQDKSKVQIIFIPICEMDNEIEKKNFNKYVKIKN